MTVVLAVATLGGALASALRLWFALRARRFARALDREIRDALWTYHFACLQQDRTHSLQHITAEELSLARQMMREEGEAPVKVIDASLEYFRESIAWRHATYRPSPPFWALRLLPTKDAHRYSLEWSAHLRGLIDEGNVGRVKADRRRLRCLRFPSPSFCGRDVSLGAKH